MKKNNKRMNGIPIELSNILIQIIDHQKLIDIQLCQKNNRQQKQKNINMFFLCQKIILMHGIEIASLKIMQINFI